MKKQIGQLFLALAVVFLSSCKKDSLINSSASDLAPIVSTTAQPVSSLLTGNVPIVVPADATIYDLGTGSDDLTIDGSTLKLNGNSFVRIKGGTYRNITIKNISSTVANPVIIKNNGQVRITGAMSTDNLSNVIISGDNNLNITYGISFENISYRAISMNGKIAGVTLKSMSFTNVGDYVISGSKNNGSELAYTGTAETRSERFKVLSCLFDNAGTIAMGGNLNKDTGEDSGFFKDVEVAYNTFQNTNAGSVCSFTNVQDYNIHHNVVNNINTTNDNHNGVFFMQGNGNFHDNKLTNYQGNSIRMWLYSRGTTSTVNLIYNNLCYNTRKYGAFELQVFDRNIVPGKTTYTNAKVYNNTAGKMDSSKQWEGQMLDLYNTGGTLEYYNNLGFNMVTVKDKVTNMINNMGDAKITVETNNKYTLAEADAIASNSTFVTKYSGIGASGL